MNCTSGKHILLELSGCPGKLLNNAAYIEQTFETAVQIAGANVIARVSHHFAPTGVSVVFVLSESHLSIHTWPDQGYAAIDCYTCGKCDSEGACRHIAQELEARDLHLTVVDRGLSAQSGTYYHAMKERS